MATRDIPNVVGSGNHSLVQLSSWLTWLWREADVRRRQMPPRCESGSIVCIVSTYTSCYKNADLLKAEKLSVGNKRAYNLLEIIGSVLKWPMRHSCSPKSE